MLRSASAVAFAISLGALPIPARQSGAPSALSGVVLDSLTRKPLAGVFVQLLPARVSDGTHVTDDLGRFAFTGLPAGKYFVRAYKGGYSTGYSGDRGRTALGAAVVLSDGQWFRGVSLELSRLAVIAGKVSKQNGQPVVGVQVHAIARLSVGGRSVLAVGPTARTDDRGQYRITDIPPGRYLPMVPLASRTVPESQIGSLKQDASSRGQALSAAIVASGFGALYGGDSTGLMPEEPRVSYSTTFFPNATNLGGGQFLEVGVGDSLNGIDITMTPGRTRTISGSLHGDATDFSGTTLRLVPVGLETLGFWGEGAVAVAQRNGHFLFQGVPPGDYVLSVPGSVFELVLRPANSFRPQVERPYSINFAPVTERMIGGSVGLAPSLFYELEIPGGVGIGRNEYASRTLTIGDKDVEELSIDLSPAGSVKGIISYDESVDGPSGGLLELVPANLDFTASVRTVPLNPSSTQQVDYEFGIEGVLPGEYAMRLIAIPGVVIESATLDGADVTRRPLQIASGHRAELRIVLSGRRTSISGFVRTEAGDLPSHAVTLAFPVDRALWRGYGLTSNWIRSSAVASDGSYALLDMMEGDYYLVALPASEASAGVDPQFLASKVLAAKRVSLRLGDAKPLDLTLVEAK